MDHQTLTDEDGCSVVGLMADPGVPRKVAASIADDLSDDLTRELGGLWRVEVNEETIPLGPDGEIRLTEHAPRLLQQHSWDFVLYLTDLPTGPDGIPQLYDVSGSTASALVSLPVLGVFRVESKVRALARQLVCASSGLDGLGVPGTDGLPDAKRSGAIVKTRLLAGMVFNNRPTRLTTALAGVVAAAAGSGAFGIFFGSIAALSVELHPLRLLLISIVGVATLVTWLIMRNGLWNWSNRFTPGNRRLDNAATVLTVGIGVGVMFLGLLVAMFLLAILVMDSNYLESQLGRPTTVFDYVRLAWLSSCLGTFAGALGSNFDDEETVRVATYSLRWHERRKLFDAYQKRDSDQPEQQEEREQERVDREYGDDDHGDDDNSEGERDRSPEREPHDHEPRGGRPG